MVPEGGLEPPRLEKRGILNPLKTQSIDANKLFGYDIKQTQYDDVSRAKTIKRKTKQASISSSILDDFSKNCYFGGRNEAMVCGYTSEDIWYDYDLPSAYTTTLLDISIPDYSKLKQIRRY